MASKQTQNKVKITRSQEIKVILLYRVQEFTTSLTFKKEKRKKGKLLVFHIFHTLCRSESLDSSSKLTFQGV